MSHERSRVFTGSLRVVCECTHIFRKISGSVNAANLTIREQMPEHITRVFSGISVWIGLLSLVRQLTLRAVVSHNPPLSAGLVSSHVKLNFMCGFCFKETVHLKMKMLSSLTHLHVKLFWKISLFCCLYKVNGVQKINYIKMLYIF